MYAVSIARHHREQIALLDAEHTGLAERSGVSLVVKLARVHWSTQTMQPSGGLDPITGVEGSDYLLHSHEHLAPNRRPPAVARHRRIDSQREVRRRWTIIELGHRTG